MNYRKLTIYTLVGGIFLAIMAAGPGAAMFPKSFLLSGDLYCEEGTKPGVLTQDASYGTTRGYTVHPYCEDESGNRAPANLFLAVGGLILIYLLPALVVGFTLSYLLLRWVASGSAEVEAAKERILSSARRKSGRQGNLSGSSGQSMADLIKASRAQDGPAALNPLPEEPGQLNSSGSAVARVPAERLKEVQEAFDQGLISEEEYKAKRKEILEQI